MPPHIRHVPGPRGRDPELSRATSRARATRRPAWRGGHRRTAGPHTTPSSSAGWPPEVVSVTRRSRCRCNVKNLVRIGFGYDTSINHDRPQPLPDVNRNGFLPPATASSNSAMFRFSWRDPSEAVAGPAEWRATLRRRIRWLRGPGWMVRQADPRAHGSGRATHRP